MTDKSVGIDSTTFYHDGKTSFKAPLGVAIVVNDYEQFNRKYMEIMSELKQKYTLDTPRVCVKGHFVASKIGNDRSRGFTSDFVDRILPHIEMIDVNHVIISPTKVPEIFYTNGTKVSTMKFVDTLTSSFNHVIVWNLLNRFNEMNKSNLFVDYFTGATTSAWEESENNNKLHLFSAGEYCNSLISTADLICKYINDYLFTNREKLGFDGISKAFSAKNITEISRNGGSYTSVVNGDNKTKLHQTNYSPFALITPNSKRNIEVDMKLKHPVSFVLPSHKLAKEKGILENLPLFDILTNHAHKNFGCVKSINLDDIQNEVRYMKNGDRIITIGDDAFDKANYLKNFGLDIDIVSSVELLKK